MSFFVNRIILLIVLATVATTATAQIHTSYRYTRFARNEQNKELFDTTNPYSFYNLIVQTIERLSDGKNQFDYKGMQSSDMAKLRVTYGKDWHSIPNLKMRLGPQRTRPIANRFGEDSVLYLADGTAEYIYPARDSIFFYFGEYSDIVLKEQVVFDSITGTESVEPLEVFLRKQLFQHEEPSVVLSFNWELLYLMKKERMVPILENESQTLLAAYESFLAMAEKRFGREGCYEFMRGQNLFRCLDESRAIHKITDYDVVFNEWNALKKATEMEGVFYEIDSNEIVLVNEYGEDSLVYDIVLKDFKQVIQLHTDTVYYVKNQFNSLYEYRCLYHDDLKGWEEYLQALIVTKKVPGNQHSLSVAHTMKYKTGLQELSEEESLRQQYNDNYNPLSRYLQQTPIKQIPTFDWEIISMSSLFLGEQIVL